MKIAALLLRCSTDAQDYERQKLDLIDATKRLGYSTSDELIFGQYITGKDNVRNKDRESIALCKQAVLEKRVDAIFINEVSRLSRDSIAGRLFFCGTSFSSLLQEAKFTHIRTANRAIPKNLNVYRLMCL